MYMMLAVLRDICISPFCIITNSQFCVKSLGFWVYNFKSSELYNKLYTYI
jgi:hypothetical protein